MEEEEKDKYHLLKEDIGWFFFDLLILGYVEDPDTGKSFRFPGGLHWAVYIEVNLYQRGSYISFIVQLYVDDPTE